MHCWGENRTGQLGARTEERIAATPQQVDGVAAAQELAAGGLHTCARMGDGTVSCWGANSHGQLGDGVTLHATRPVLAVPPTRALLERASSL